MDDELSEVPCEELGDEEVGCLAVDVPPVGAGVPDGASCLGVGGFVVVPLGAVPELVPALGVAGDVPDDGALVAGADEVVESVPGEVDEGASSLVALRPEVPPLQLVATVPAPVAALVLAAVGSAAAGPSLPQSA